MTLITTLIIEDDHKIAEIQKIFTEKVEGYSVVGIAHTIEEAEALLPVLQPELVLLDIFFPDGDGLSLLWKIRANFRKTDVVLITAAKEVEFFEEGMRGGVFDYILKPLVFNRFAATLEQYKLHRKRLTTLQQLNQQDVDRLLRQASQQEPGKPELPKGIDAITLKKITAMMTALGHQGISAERAGSRIGVSRTTSRRYLEFLVASGVLVADLDYGTPGRPERIYRLKISST